MAHVFREDLAPEVEVEALDELEWHALLYGQRQNAAGARAGNDLEELPDPAARTPLELLEHLLSHHAGEGVASVLQVGCRWSWVSCAEV